MNRVRLERQPDHPQESIDGSFLTLNLQDVAFRKLFDPQDWQRHTKRVDINFLAQDTFADIPVGSRSGIYQKTFDQYQWVAYEITGLWFHLLLEQYILVFSCGDLDEKSVHEYYPVAVECR